MDLQPPRDIWDATNEFDFAENEKSVEVFDNFSVVEEGDNQGASSAAITFHNSNEERDRYSNDDTGDWKDPQKISDAQNEIPSRIMTMPAAPKFQNMNQTYDNNINSHNISRRSVTAGSVDESIARRQWFTANPRATTALLLGSDSFGPPLLNEISTSPIPIKLSKGKIHRTINDKCLSRRKGLTSEDLPLEVIHFHEQVATNVSQNLKSCQLVSPGSRQMSRQSKDRQRRPPSRLMELPSMDSMNGNNAYSVITDENGFTDFTITDPLTKAGNKGRSLTAAKKSHKERLQHQSKPSLSLSHLPDVLRRSR